MNPNLVAEIYASFVFLCAVPWALNWATRGGMPVSTRLFALFTFSLFLTESGFTLWQVHADAPDRLGDAIRLLTPIIFASLLGMNFVTISLVKIVKSSIKQNDDETN